MSGAKVKTQFRWDEPLLPMADRMYKFLYYVEDIVDLVAEEYAPKIELWMKYNAKWHDVTGAAREGLRVWVQHTKRVLKNGSPSMNVILVLENSVDYGAELELMEQGRFGVIKFCLDYWAPLLINAVKERFTRFR